MLGIDTAKNTVIIVLLLIIIASAGGNLWQHFDNARLASELSLARQNYNTARQNFSNCDNSVTKLNKEITLQAQNIKLLNAELGKLNNDLVSKEKANNVLLNKIKNEKAPTTCKELEDYLFKNIGNLTW